MEHARLFRSKVKWISLFLSVLVVFIHGTNTTQMDPDLLAAHVEGFVTGNLAVAAVPIFYAMSAFLFYQNFDFSKLLSKYKSRFRTLVIPFLLWNTVYMIVFYFLSRLPFINQEVFDLTLPNIVDGVFRNKYNMAYWFMQQLIVFTVLCPVIHMLMRNRYVALAVYAGILVLYSMGYQNRFGIDIRSLLFYLIGVYCGIHHRDRIMEGNRFHWIGLAAFVASQVLFYSGLVEMNLFFAWLHIALLLVAMFFCVNLIINREVPKFLQCSFEIYTLHILILETFNKLASFILPPNSNWILIDFFLSPVLTIGIITVISQLIRRYLPRFYRFAFGGR